MAHNVEAPLAGTILDVLVEAGDSVEAGDELIVIEAMKMQNLIYAPVGGSVTEIRVKAGDKVQTDDLLIVLS